MKTTRISFAFLSALVALAGCGGGSGDSSTPEDPLAFYKNQEVAWGSCHQYFPEDSSLSPYGEYIAKLGDRLQCADIKVPLDYQHPHGIRISLSMLRVLAASSPESKPSMLFNPGGPGGDGQLDSLVFSMLLANGSQDTPLGRKYQELSKAYNFVGFSPRGVGASSNLICAGNELVYEIDPTRWGDSVENIRRLTDQARYTASNCQKNPIAGYVGTDATARDMDLMRHLLGDEKLHYHGTSYGTWLGFWYAGLFPENAGPMVLDSNMNFSLPIHRASISYIEGEIHTFKAFIAPYAARHDDVLGMGSSPEAIIDDLNRLGHASTQALHMISGGFRAESQGIPRYLATVKVAIETQKLLDDGESLDDIERILTENPYIHDDPQIEKAFIKQAGAMVKALKALEDPAYYTNAEPFFLDNGGSVWDTVICNDEPLHNTSQDYWIEAGFDLAKRLPLARNRVASQPCLHWHRHESLGAKPSMPSLEPVPLLLVQSEFDVPTPLTGAMETFDKLPNASMVYVKDEGAHGIFLYQTQCVDITVIDYLLGQPPAQRLTECQGLPLALDEREPKTDKLKSVRTETPTAPSNFKDPELAQELMDILRKANSR